MDQMYQPTTCGFLAEAGPPTPEKNEPMSTASGPSSLTTTTQLPANLPTYAPMAPPIGLLPVPIGMPPGLRLPPPGAHHLLLGQAGNAAMATHLLGQSILAGLGAGAGPSGFFFNPAHLHQPMQTNEMNAADDMELEEAEDDVHHKKQMDGRRWNETTENTNVEIADSKRSNVPVAEILATVDVVVTIIDVSVGVGMFAPPDHMLIIANASAQFCFARLVGI